MPLPLAAVFHVGDGRGGGRPCRMIPSGRSRYPNPSSGTRGTRPCRGGRLHRRAAIEGVHHVGPAGFVRLLLLAQVGKVEPEGVEVHHVLQAFERLADPRRAIDFGDSLLGPREATRSVSRRTSRLTSVRRHRERTMCRRLWSWLSSVIVLNSLYGFPRNSPTPGMMPIGTPARLLITRAAPEIHSESARFGQISDA